MDNRIFNVNGEGSEMLLKALELAFMQQGAMATCSSWVESKDKGLILCWLKGRGDNDLPCDMTAPQVLPMVEQWLKSDFAKDVEPDERCSDYDHDGHNEMGWQVYCEAWGHVGSNHYAICAIRTAYLWMGK